MYYKNLKLKPAKGGYLISYDKHMASTDAYDGMRYVGEEEEIFEDGDKALARLDELYKTMEEHEEAMETIRSTASSMKSKAEKE